MEPPFPSPTATWHNDTYSAIHPVTAKLSHEGRTVIITGAGSGVGRATALAYAEAGAEHIVVIGRTESTLRETKTLIDLATKSREKVKVSVFVCSVVDKAAIQNVAKTVGSWHVLVLNAGYISSPISIVDVEVDEFWKAYETNVKSIVIAAQAFFPNAQPGAAALVIGAAGSIFPPAWPGLSSYMSSKVAQAKLVEYLAVENPGILICSVHPGVVDTKMLRTAELKGLPPDTAELPAHFLVWLSHDAEKTKFLGGKFVWVNWDVDELVTLAREIKDTELFSVGLMGWPFTAGQGKASQYI